MTDASARRSSSDDGSETPTMVVFHKTKMCTFHLKGRCARGSACLYAHHREELRPAPDFSRTRPCKTLADTGECNDPRCSYAHDRKELRRRKCTPAELQWRRTKQQVGFKDDHQVLDVPTAVQIDVNDPGQSAEQNTNCALALALELEKNRRPIRGRVTLEESALSSRSTSMGSRSTSTMGTASRTPYAYNSSRSVASFVLPPWTESEKIEQLSDSDLQVEVKRTFLHFTACEPSSPKSSRSSSLPRCSP
mmetsp:Transcript_8608/g.20257  ORF Transcript_8608/g.20257 Transcript_8608/m.20257 type:complete len:250 (-) Transcript_8608:60-809(-)